MTLWANERDQYESHLGKAAVLGLAVEFAVIVAGILLLNGGLWLWEIL